MEGAGSLRLANYLYSAAPRDGSVIGAISRGAAFDPLLNEKGAQFDASKLLLDRQRQQRSQRMRRAAILRDYDIRGCPDQAPDHRLNRGRRRHLSIPRRDQRGARHQIQDRHRLSGRQRCQPGARTRRSSRPLRLVAGRASMTTRLDWITSKKIVILVQLSLSKHPDLPNVPLIMDFAKTERTAPDIQAYFCTAGDGPAVSGAARPARRSARRAAPGFYRDDDGQGVSWPTPAASKFEINPVDGEQIEALVKEIYQTPPRSRRKAAAIMGQ